ncbi:MAG: hypothetical protein HT580_11345 [Dechloromonas sp.]|nr:MAG: hypothetical protein HT580_11345 [Dechloromonas sp.]
MMNLPKPTLIACLMAAAIAGPIGCANQQAMSPPDDFAANPGMQPLQVDPL